MPTVKLTPKEARILRKFKTARVGVDAEYPIVQLLVKLELLKKVTKKGEADSMVITTAGTDYLTTIGG